MALDIFDLAFMSEMLLQMKTPKTFVSDMVFNGQNPIKQPTEKIVCDFWDEDRKLAPFVLIEDEHHTVQRNSYQAKEFVPANISMKMKTSAEDISKRQPGNPIFNQFSPLELAAQQVAMDVLVMQNMATRTKEWMACQIIQNGQVTVAGKGHSVVISYGMKTTHKASTNDLSGGANAWDQTTSKPWDNLEDMERLIEDDSGMSLGMVILGRSAVRSFLRHAEVLARLDNREFHVGRVEPTKLPNGAKYIGTIEDVDYYSYNETYLDSTGTKQDYIDPTYAIGIARGLAANVYFGMINDVEAGNIQNDYFTKSWVTPSPSARWVSLQSRPLPLLKQIDGVVVYKVQ